MSDSRPDTSRIERAREIVTASTQHNYDKGSVIARIKELMPRSEMLTGLKKTYEEGEIIIKENQKNDKLYIILDGYIALMKAGAGMNTPIDMQGPGDFIGLLSFQTGEPAFTTSRASTRVNMLCIDHKSFELFLTRYPDISKIIQGLIFSNLSERYRRVVTLHVEVALLSKQLEQERNQLQKAIQELEKTRNLLINQEKMATLGELTAGLAHEINNPASALLRSVDYLIKSLPDLAERASALPDTGLVRFFFEAGFNREIGSSSEVRNRLKELTIAYPHILRSNLRVLAEMNDQVIAKIKPFVSKKEHQELLLLLIEAYQSGIFMSGIKLSTSRIEYLVKSLKSYSRQTGAEPEVTDIREGIRETLLIIGNRLNDVELIIDLPEIPMVQCFIGEINQVWTNIIINACDAMNDRGKLFITCGSDNSDIVWVRIGDTGPGIPDLIKKRIFDSSYTTKTAGGDFGLGIGLAISKGIVEKHRGTIHVQDREGGGAEFVIKLPVYKKTK